MKKKEALEVIARGAVRSERKFNLPAELVAAQIILESGWLRSAPGNNPVGIKWSPDRHKERQLLVTKEWLTDRQAERFETDGRKILERLSEPRESDGKSLYRVMDWFAVYPSIEDAIEDHGRLLTRSGRYQRVLAARNWRDAIRLLGLTGYATDPDYASKLMSVVTAEVMEALDRARASAAQEAGQEA